MYQHFAFYIFLKSKKSKINCGCYNTNLNLFLFRYNYSSKILYFVLNFKLFCNSYGKSLMPLLFTLKNWRANCVCCFFGHLMIIIITK